MSDKISRRDFLKLARCGRSHLCVLDRLRPGRAIVTREPYTKMPEYTYNGQSTYYATTCRECAAGCGLVVRTMQGRALKVEGNKNNPVDLGKTCVRGQATLHGLYNPDRVTDPGKQSARGSSKFTTLEWDAAVNVVADALKQTLRDRLPDGHGSRPSFRPGLRPGRGHRRARADPLWGAGHVRVARHPQQGRRGSRRPGRHAFLRHGQRRRDLLLRRELPRDVAFAGGLHAKLFQHAPQPNHARGYLVHFEARMSQTASKADEWIPLKPGTEGLVAQAIGRLAAADERAAARSPRFSPLWTWMPQPQPPVSAREPPASGGLVLEGQGRARHRRSGAGQSNGLETAESVLALNALVGGLGRAGRRLPDSAGPDAGRLQPPGQRAGDGRFCR